MVKLLDVLFGCTHRRTTFPITAKAGPRRSEAASVTGTYVVCLDCGREFAYDWHQMKIVEAVPVAQATLEESAEIERAA